jgi:hypothetical protein
MLAFWSMYWLLIFLLSSSSSLNSSSIYELFVCSAIYATAVPAPELWIPPEVLTYLDASLGVFSASIGVSE